MTSRQRSTDLWTLLSRQNGAAKPDFEQPSVHQYFPCSAGHGLLKMGNPLQNSLNQQPAGFLEAPCMSQRRRTICSFAMSRLRQSGARTGCAYASVQRMQMLQPRTPMKWKGFRRRKSSEPKLLECLVSSAKRLNPTVKGPPSLAYGLNGNGD